MRWIYSACRGGPLPQASYGGTSMVTLMAGFGILMSIQTHRRLLA
ncbi:FtsW/RodA/SpoVE family cell cycle protein [Aeromonas rivipollensis]